MLITKNGLWTSVLTFSAVVAGGYHSESIASSFYSDAESYLEVTGVFSSGTESYQATQIAGDTCEITEQQQHMLDLINAARTQARSCGDEFYQATTPLSWSCQLADSATMHTTDMTTNNFISHSGSDGLRAGDRLLANGYDWQQYGENLAAGFIFSEQAMEGFLTSPGHCINIMNPDATKFGSYMAFGDNLDYQSYWTQVFAAPM
jgi:uncharacterized protein YkwD